MRSRRLARWMPKAWPIWRGGCVRCRGSMGRRPAAPPTCDGSRSMKAVWYETNGAADEVLAHGDMADPVPASGEVLVRLHASGVNPSDVKARAGSRPMGFPRVIPHSDGAGIVEAVGAGTDPALVGTRVFVRNGQWRRPSVRRPTISRLKRLCSSPRRGRFRDRRRAWHSGADGGLRRSARRSGRGRDDPCPWRWRDGGAACCPDCGR